MSWADRAIEELSKGNQVTIHPRGNSMKGRVNDGQEVNLIPPTHPLNTGDVVLVKAHGRVYLHLIKAVQGDRYLIGNNVGGINGWANKAAVYGVMI